MTRHSRWLVGLCVLTLLSGTACAKKSSKAMDADFQAIGNKALADFNAGAASNCLWWLFGGTPPLLRTGQRCPLGGASRVRIQRALRIC
jgi:hypothetical protein